MPALFTPLLHSELPTLCRVKLHTHAQKPSAPRPSQQAVAKFEITQRAGHCFVSSSGKNFHRRSIKSQCSALLLLNSWFIPQMFQWEIFPLGIRAISFLFFSIPLTPVRSFSLFPASTGFIFCSCKVNRSRQTVQKNKKTIEKNKTQTGIYLICPNLSLCKNSFSDI